MTVDQHPGFPCRVSLEDVDIGERVLLMNYEHQPAASPYRSSHAIIVREGAVQARPGPGAVPAHFRERLLAFRAFDGDGMMTDAEVADGTDFEAAVENMFSDQAVRYLHVHNARHGCYHARVDRL